MNSTEIHREFLNHQSDCYRSARYWAYREIFWSIVDHVCKLVVFITSGGAVCVKAVGGDPASVGWCAASALAAFILESFAVQGRISFAIRQCQRYNAVLLLFPIDESEENLGLLKRIRNERLIIEKDETILLECLNVYCHNKQCIAEDRPEDMWPMTRFQKMIGIWVPFDYTANIQAPPPRLIPPWRSLPAATTISHKSLPSPRSTRHGDGDMLTVGIMFFAEIAADDLVKLIVGVIVFLCVCNILGRMRSSRRNSRRRRKQISQNHRSSQEAQDQEMGYFGGITKEEEEIREAFDELDAAIPLAVKLQREGGDTKGALNALRGIVKAALAVYTPKASYEFFKKRLVIEKTLDKARLVYQRANQPPQAVACGMVAYVMTAKRLFASADNLARRVAELRSPQTPLLLHDIETKKELEESAKFEEDLAKSELAKACAAMSDEAIHNEATRLLKKMKMDVALADKILVVVKEPQDNPWKLFNAVMSVIS